MTLVSWCDGDRDASNTYFAKEVAGTRWNGWAVPWFSDAEASRIAEDMATNFGYEDMVRWNEAKGVWEVLADSDESDVWEQMPSKVDRDGIRLWCWFGGSWCWQEVKGPNPDDVDPEAEEEFERFKVEVDRAILAHADIVSRGMTHYAKVR